MQSTYSTFESCVEGNPCALQGQTFVFCLSSYSHKYVSYSLADLSALITEGGGFCSAQNVQRLVQDYSHF
jgi:hypothetical protein